MVGIEHTEITAGLWHLRVPRVTEAGEVVALAGDGETARWSAALPKDEEGAVAWLVERAVWEGQVTFSILESVTERWAGHVSVDGLDTADPVVVCRVAPWARGRSAATTAVRCVTGWASAVLDVPRLTLAHAADDVAACRVAAKCGYALTSATPSTHLHIHTP